MNREADGIDIFLERGVNNFFSRIVNAKIDDLDAGISERPGNYFHAPVMAVQSGLGDENAEFLARIGSLVLGGFHALLSRSHVCSSGLACSLNVLRP